MSGHSHFKTVKATKDANDAKKGRAFSKLARVIAIAVKEKGADMAINSQLKSAIEKAKEFNMPKDNIERAIKKGTGELAGENLEESSFEAFGPGGIAIIINAITNNKNRTLGEIKSILSQYSGKMAGEGSVRWMFERKGLIIVNPELKTKEGLELLAIEAGAGDFRWRDNMLYIYTNPDELEKVKKSLKENNAKVESATMDLFSKEEIDLTGKEKELAQKLFEALDENDAVQEIYSNLRVN